MRLFDKGEANTFSDDVTRFELVRKHLLRGCAEYLSGEVSEGHKLLKKYLERKFAVISEELQSYLILANPMKIDDMFLFQSDFELNQTFLERKLFIMQVLSDMFGEAHDAKSHKDLMIKLLAKHGDTSARWECLEKKISLQ